MKKKGTSFSILNLILLTTITALVVAIYFMRLDVLDAERRAANAEMRFQELESRFGYIEASKKFKTRFKRIQPDSEETMYRASFPKGSRYLLHLSDVQMKGSNIPQELVPTKTMSMNGWRDGADVVLKWGVFTDDKKVFDVRTETEQLFSYEIKDWTRPNGFPNEGFDLDADELAEFDPDEIIILSYFGNEKLERGIVLWLEPHEQWEKRQKKHKNE